MQRLFKTIRRNSYFEVFEKTYDVNGAKVLNCYFLNFADYPSFPPLWFS